MGTLATFTHSCLMNIRLLRWFHLTIRGRIKSWFHWKRPINFRLWEKEGMYTCLSFTFFRNKRRPVICKYGLIYVSVARVSQWLTFGFSSRVSITITITNQWLAKLKHSLQKNTTYHDTILEVLMSLIRSNWLFIHKIIRSYKLQVIHSLLKY